MMLLIFRCFYFLSGVSWEVTCRGKGMRGDCYLELRLVHFSCQTMRIAAASAVVSCLAFRDLALLLALQTRKEFCSSLRISSVEMFEISVLLLMVFVSHRFQH